MDGSRWEPPEAERALGLGFYASSAPGVGGVLKRRADDFLVEELSAYPRPSDDGPFTVLRVESRDWEQHELAAALAARVGVAPHAVRWAGTKDRRAVAERIFGYRGAPPASTELGLVGVRVLDAYRTRDEVVLGHHFGNRFDIRVRDVGPDLAETRRRVAAVADELAAARGFPNFFGPQRFGEVRPVTHEVGRALVRGDVAGAVDRYLTAVPGDGEPLGAEARRAYATHRDPARALREFPPAFRFERTLLDHLQRGHDPARALQALDRKLRTLFIHAYQAYLFNRYLVERRATGLSLLEPEPGDALLRAAHDGTFPGREPIPVTDDNLPEARAMVARGTARLAAPLVGFRTPPSSGRPGRLLEALLAEEGVTRERFQLPATPEIASAGNLRPMWAPLPPIRSDAAEDAGSVVLRFAFSLPRGTYATTLLREFMKPGARAVPAAPAGEISAESSRGF